MISRQDFANLCKETCTSDEISAYWTWFSSHDFADRASFESALQRLLGGEPIQYIFNSAPFHRYEFEVGPGCLIPRPETEELVERVLNHPQSQSITQWLDVGTGSGCIALTLAQERSEWNVLAVDESAQALNWAQRNWQQLPESVQQRVRLQQTDFLSWSAWPEGIQAVISNPPYIADYERPTIQERVDQWEPHQALYSPGNALLFYQKMADLCLLSHTAIWLFLEVNQALATETEHLFKQVGCATKKIADFSGNLRFIEANWPGRTTN